MFETGWSGSTARISLPDGRDDARGIARRANRRDRERHTTAPPSLARYGKYISALTGTSMPIWRTSAAIPTIVARARSELAPPSLKRLPMRVFARPELARHRLVDDCDGLRFAAGRARRSGGPQHREYPWS